MEEILNIITKQREVYHQTDSSIKVNEKLLKNITSSIEVTKKHFQFWLQVKDILETYKLQKKELISTLSFEKPLRKNAESLIESNVHELIHLLDINSNMSQALKRTLYNAFTNPGYRDFKLQKLIKMSWVK